MSMVPSKDIDDVKRRLKLALDLLTPGPPGGLVDGIRLPKQTNTPVPPSHIEDAITVLNRAVDDMNRLMIEADRDPLDPGQ